MRNLHSYFQWNVFDESCKCKDHSSKNIEISLYNSNFVSFTLNSYYISWKTNFNLN